MTPVVAVKPQQVHHRDGTVLMVYQDRVVIVFARDPTHPVELNKDEAAALAWLLWQEFKN